jgi:hypothetical protein
VKGRFWCKLAIEGKAMRTRSCDLGSQRCLPDERKSRLEKAKYSDITLTCLYLVYSRNT